MIEIFGEEGTSEHSAALAIGDSLEKLWPGISNTSRTEELVRVSAGVKISGYKVSDIDVVVAAVFKNNRRLIPRRIVRDMDGNRLVKRPVTVRNLVAVIEVKEHDESGVRISGDNINVKYRGPGKGWKSATEQNVKQVHSLSHYARDLGCDIFIHRCIVMLGLGAIRVNGAVCSGFSGIDFLTAIATVGKVQKGVGGYTLSSGSDGDVWRFLEAPIFLQIRPTSLDRRRMDAIASEASEGSELVKYLGHQMVKLRGHGGTGKTILLLQAAWKSFEHNGERSLVLTYNHALAADIRRLLNLMRIPSSPEEGGIKVATVMSFMYSWFSKLQLIEPSVEDNFDEYENTCKAALELIRGGALTRTDIDGIIGADPDVFEFHHVLVDEAQDWPQVEVNLLKKLYEPRRIALADGIDQMLRGHQANWDAGVEGTYRQVIGINRCLRMKRNLAVFSIQLAKSVGINWDVEPNQNAGGGRIIILTTAYENHIDLHEELIRSAKENGNAEIDFLFCVSPMDVHETITGKGSTIGDWLAERGEEVWDGVNASTRTDFPRSSTQYRVVQYASCRGLEGWTVILEKADQYWERCKKESIEKLVQPEDLAFESVDELAVRAAWKKMFIAMTRPIDTLVVSLQDPSSEFSSKILRLGQHLDYVQIRGS